MLFRSQAAQFGQQIAARCDRLIRLRDGAVIDDIEIADGRPVEETIRRVGQLG